MKRIWNVLTASLAAVVLSGVVAWSANNAISVLVPPGTNITLCSFDITGSGGAQAYCTVPTDVKGNALYGTDGSSTQLAVCNQEAQYDTNTNGITQIVALASSKKIYVCGYSFFAAGTVSVNLTQGTGTNCATGTNTKMSPTYQFTAQTGFVDDQNFGATTGPNVSVVSQALCIQTNAGVAVQARVRFAQY